MKNKVFMGMAFCLCLSLLTSCTMNTTTTDVDETGNAVSSGLSETAINGDDALKEVEITVDNWDEYLEFVEVARMDYGGGNIIPVEIMDDPQAFMQENYESNMSYVVELILQPKNESITGCRINGKGTIKMQCSYDAVNVETGEQLSSTELFSDKQQSEEISIYYVCGEYGDLSDALFRTKYYTAYNNELYMYDNDIVSIEISDISGIVSFE